MSINKGNEAKRSVSIDDYDSTGKDYERDERVLQFLSDVAGSVANSAKKTWQSVKDKWRRWRNRNQKPV